MSELTDILRAIANGERNVLGDHWSLDYCTDAAARIDYLESLSRADEWMSTKKLAALFHNTYEELAPSFGYETRADTKELDFDSPNGKLMLAVCERITTTGE